MRNLRSRYTYEQRLEFQATVNDLRQYIMPLLLEKQGNTCALCHQPAPPYDIDHTLYNPMMTLYDLRALCWPCHKSVTDFTPFSNREV